MFQVEILSVANKLKRQGRVRFVAPADYSEGGEIYKLVCAIIDKVKADDVLRDFENKGK